MNLPEAVLAAAIPIGSLLLSMVAWWGSNRARIQANRLETIKVNADAYEQAQGIYDKAIDQLTERNEQLERQVDRCEARIDQLEQALRAAGIAVPPEPRHRPVTNPNGR
jgi:cell division protein FtsB